jgi:hypothetical protein
MTFFKRVRMQCVCCGIVFGDEWPGLLMISKNAGICTDLRPHYSWKAHSISETLLYSCFGCGFTNWSVAQWWKRPCDDRLRAFVEARIKPQLADREPRDAATPGFSKFERFAEIRRFQGADDAELALYYLRASWTTTSMHLGGEWQSTSQRCQALALRHVETALSRPVSLFPELRPLYSYLAGELARRLNKPDKADSYFRHARAEAGSEGTGPLVARLAELQMSQPTEQSCWDFNYMVVDPLSALRVTPVLLAADKLSPREPSQAFQRYLWAYRECRPGAYRAAAFEPPGLVEDDDAAFEPPTREDAETFQSEDEQTLEPAGVDHDENPSWSLAQLGKARDHTAVDGVHRPLATSALCGLLKLLPIATAEQKQWVLTEANQLSPWLASDDLFEQIRAHCRRKPASRARRPCASEAEQRAFWNDPPKDAASDVMLFTFALAFGRDQSENSNGLERSSRAWMESVRLRLQHRSDDCIAELDPLIASSSEIASNPLALGLALAARGAQYANLRYEEYAIFDLDRSRILLFDWTTTSSYRYQDNPIVSGWNNMLLVIIEAIVAQLTHELILQGSAERALACGDFGRRIALEQRSALAIFVHQVNRAQCLYALGDKTAASRMFDELVRTDLNKCAEDRYSRERAAFGMWRLARLAEALERKQEGRHLLRTAAQLADTWACDELAPYHAEFVQDLRRLRTASR